MKISRRQAIGQVTALLGGAALVGGNALLAAAGVDRSRTEMADFTQAEIDWLDEVAESLLPETGTPGAKAAAVGPFVALMVTDCYDRDEQEIFRRGMQALEKRCHAMQGKAFLAASPDERHSLLVMLDREQKSHMDAKGENEPTHYFRMMKELALLGYFTSEIGYMQAMRYVEAPGRYDPCAPYSPGDKAWAPHG